jgi:hypothetical protein
MRLSKTHYVGEESEANLEVSSYSDKVDVTVNQLWEM